MTCLKEKLLKDYILKDSIKDYKGYKVKPPKETISKIESSFEKINLKVKYTPNTNVALRKYYPFQIGQSVLYPEGKENIILLKTNGKGVTSILSRASATAELVERFTGYGLAKGNIRHYLASMKQKQIWMKKREKNKFLEEEFEFAPMDINDFIKEELLEKYKHMKKSVCYSLTNKKLFCFPEEFIINTVGSNGLASGNTFEEATLHALFEVIERLGGMYVLDNLPDAKKISKDSITHPTIKKLIEVINSIGVEFEMLDFSYIFNIPMIVTIFDNPEWNLPANPFGITTNMRYPKMLIGVDTEPQDAAMRCFTEFIQGSFPINFAIHNDTEIANRFKTADLPLSEKAYDMFKTSMMWRVTGNQPLNIDLRSFLNIKRKEISINDIPSLYDLNQKVEIDRLVKTLKEKNIEVFVQDITNPFLKFPVSLVIISGGKDYFSQMPLTGYNKLILKEKDQTIRFSILSEIFKRIITGKSLNDLLRDGNWCKDPNQQELISYVTSDLIYFGEYESLSGVSINKFYFIGMLYLRLKNYDQAKKCFEAALYGSINNIPALIALSYTYSKMGKTQESTDIKDHIETISSEPIDVSFFLQKMNDPTVDPNPFEICDFECCKKTKPKLCENCFFNYVSEDIFMKNKIDDLF
jgi:YcaO-like protein with predicted kinase domain